VPRILFYRHMVCSVPSGRYGTVGTYTLCTVRVYHSRFGVANLDPSFYSLTVRNPRRVERIPLFFFTDELGTSGCNWLSAPSAGDAHAWRAPPEGGDALTVPASGGVACGHEVGGRGEMGDFPCAPSADATGISNLHAAPLPKSLSLSLQAGWHLMQGQVDTSDRTVRRTLYSTVQYSTVQSSPVQSSPVLVRLVASVDAVPALGPEGFHVSSGSYHSSADVRTGGSEMTSA
jgi:hypothetical protein